jgi:hypothetical protein
MYLLTVLVVVKPNKQTVISSLDKPDAWREGVDMPASYPFVLACSSGRVAVPQCHCYLFQPRSKSYYGSYRSSLRQLIPAEMCAHLLTNKRT